MNVSAPFIARPVATSLLAIAVLLTGALGYNNLPVSALPEVDFPTLRITTQFPGASPQTVASLVTTPLEQQFGQISGLTSMTSTSSFGISQITLQFDLARDIDAAAEDVQAAINAAGGVLPRDLPYPPTYAKVNPADQPILTLALTSETLPITRVDDAADTVLAQRLAEVLGVGLVSIQGGQKPAVRIRVDPRKLAAFGLSMEDVRQAVSRATVNQPKGSFDGPKQSFTINANDQLSNAEQFRPLVIAYFQGAPVRLSDVGDAISGVENNKTAAWFDGKPAVIVDIQRQPGANIIQTVDRIKGLLPNIQRSIPAGVDLSILADRTETIRASVQDVEVTLAITIVLVVAVIFVFLGKVWATVIPGVALPLSIVGTFGIMSMSGYSLDNLSLMALTISAGFVVDDAIVMIENIVRYIELGDSPLDAAYKGSKQIGFTVISLTVSLIAVFIPLLFMSGIIGRLFREFAMTLTYAIVVSAIISLTLTPMMCAKLLSAEKHDPNEKDPKKRRKSNWFLRMTEGAFDFVLKGYEWTLKIVLNHQATTLLVAVATLVATIALYLAVPKGFLPQQDTGLIIATTDADQAISFDAMKELQAKVAAIAQSDPDVAGVDSFIGAGTINTTPNTGRVTISLKPHQQRKASADEIIARLTERMKAVEHIEVSMQSSQDIQIGARVSRTQYQYTLIDSDKAELAEWSTKLADKLKTMPFLQGVTTDQVNGGLMADLTIDRDEAARVGVLPQTIDDILYDAFGQRQIATIYSQLNQYHVVIEAVPEFQLDPKSLDVLYVPATVNVTGAKSGSGPSGGSSISLNVTPQALALNTPSSAATHLPSIGSSLASPIPVQGAPDSSGALPANTAVGPGGGSTDSQNGSSALSITGSFGSGGSAANSGAGGGKGGGPVLNTAPATTIGIQVPLSNFVKLKRTRAPLSINHQAQFSSVTISFNLAKGESLSKAVEDIKAAEREIGLPDTAEGSFAGEAAEFQSSLAGEPYLLLAAVVAVYIVLGVLYESLIHPFTIISTLPSAGIGALLALRLFGYDLSIIGLIGIVLLIGIVKKNAIMMIDFALEAEREEHMPPREAIFRACLLRFRPIMMTTMAALFGAIPLALSVGPGSELRRPLGVAIIGGLLVSQVLTLYTTPVIYLAMDWLRDKTLTLLGRNPKNAPAPHVPQSGQPALAAAGMLPPPQQHAALPAPAVPQQLPPPHPEQDKP